MKYTQVFASPRGAVGNGPTGLEPSYQDPPPAPPASPAPPAPPAPPTQPTQPTQPTTPSTPTQPSQPSDPAPPPAPTPTPTPTPTPKAADTDGPAVTISKVRVDDGIAAKIACDERCAPSTCASS